jgi:hypothetical protein
MPTWYSWAAAISLPRLAGRALDEGEVPCVVAAGGDAAPGSVSIHGYGGNERTTLGTVQ